MPCRPNGHRNGGYHAYSHVNNLGGAAEAYLVKGDPRYLDILKNAYDSIQANQILATGGFGPNEQFLPRDKLRETVENTTNTFETQCGTWAGLRWPSISSALPATPSTAIGWNASR